MALYSFANGQIIPALRLLYRARYLAVLIYGDDHPDMALLDVSSSAFIHANSFEIVISSSHTQFECGILIELSLFEISSLNFVHTSFEAY